MISPCINILRMLATQINEKLGSKQGSKHHSPDLTRDIQELMKSLRRYHVYEKQPDQVIEGPRAMVQDVIVTGLRDLRKPLDDYNSLFTWLRARHRVRPLILDGWEAPRSDGSCTRGNTDAGPATVSRSARVIAGDVNATALMDGDDDSDLIEFLRPEETHEDEFRCSLDTEEDVELDMDEL